MYNWHHNYTGGVLYSLLYSDNFIIIVNEVLIFCSRSDSSESDGSGSDGSDCTCNLGLNLYCISKTVNLTNAVGTCNKLLTNNS